MWLIFNTHIGKIALTLSFETHTFFLQQVLLLFLISIVMDAAFEFLSFAI